MGAKGTKCRGLSGGSRVPKGTCCREVPLSAGANVQCCNRYHVHFGFHKVLTNSADIWSNITPKNVTFSDYLSTFKSAIEISQLSPFHWLEPALNTSSNKSTAACCQINSALNPYLGTIGPGPSSSQGSKKILNKIPFSLIQGN